MDPLQTTSSRPGRSVEKDHTPKIEAKTIKKLKDPKRVLAGRLARVRRLERLGIAWGWDGRFGSAKT